MQLQKKINFNIQSLLSLSIDTCLLSNGLYSRFVWQDYCGRAAVAIGLVVFLEALGLFILIGRDMCGML